jgi:two-component system, cell cycle sensor histidine kinase and response regulator CckA
MSQEITSQHSSRILVVEDSHIVRDRLKSLLAAVGRFEIVGHAETASDAIQLIESQRPDAIILDMRLREGTGMDVLAAIRTMSGRPFAVVLTSYPNEEYRQRCLDLGAQVFLDKTSEFDLVVSALLAASGSSVSDAGSRLMSSGPAVLYALRMEYGRIRPEWIGPNLAELTGYQPSEWMNRPLDDQIHVEDSAEVNAALERLLRDGRASCQYRFRHRIGHWIWLHQTMTLERSEDGTPLEIVGALLDVTDRERVKEAIFEREARFRVLAEATSDAIVVLEDGLILEFNRSFTDQYGYSESEMVGRPALDIVAGRSRAAARRRLAESVEDSYDLWLLRRDGTEREVTVTARMHRSGSRTLRLLALQDVTVRRQLERQMHRAQKLDAVARLAGTAAHDFNNVLTAIGGCLELALMELPADHAAREDLDTALSAVGQGTSLARQLMEFSRPRSEHEEPEECDVNDVVAREQQLVRRLLGVQVEYATQLSAGLPHAGIAASQFRQILTNLVINAKDAMPDGGVLRVETSAVVQQEHSALPPGSYVRIVVQDSGVGMSADVRSRIFEPFFTTKAQRGTGLGLASVYGLVTHAGGFIDVCSEPNQGARFEILLPSR